MSDKTNDSNTLQLQWDVGKTIFDNLSSLRNLVAAAGLDDVQPQAVLAAEALGTGILINTKRFNDAIDALGGNESLRLSEIKATIGLSSGGLRMHMRQSSALVRFFALCASLKLCFIDDEVGSLIFNMLAESNLLAKVPASSTQLSSLVSQLSGHAEKIVPTDLLEQIAQAVEQHQCKPGVYERFPITELARLFVELFEVLRDDSTRTVSLHGYCYSVWLSAALCWLLEDDVTLTINNQQVLGTSHGRLEIFIDPDHSVTWKMKVWAQGSEPHEYFYKNRDIEVTSVKRLPIKATRSFLDQHFWIGFENSQQRKKAAVVTGRVASALIQVLAEHALIRSNNVCCSAHGTACGKTQPINIVPTSWLNNISRLLENYGWDEEELQQEVPEIISTMKEMLESEQHVTSRFRSKQPANLEEEDLMAMMQEKPSIFGKLTALCQKYIERVLGTEVPATRMIEPALYLAYDAIITCTCMIEECARYVPSFAGLEMDEPDIEDHLKDLLVGGISINEFRECALKQLLPGLHDVHSGDLVISMNGLVAGMSILWSPIADQKRALGIRVMKGSIRKDNVSYGRVREVWTRGKIGPAKLQPITFERKKSKSPTIQRAPGVDPEHSFDVNVAVSNDVLEIKRFVALRVGDRRHKASWLAAAFAIATADHINPLGVPDGLQKSLGERLMDESLEAPMYWAPLPLPPPRIQKGTRTVVSTNEIEPLRVFAAGCSRDWSEEYGCVRLLIRHGGSLMQCLEAAKATGDTWMLIY